MTQVNRIGIDIANHIFHIHGVDELDRPVLERRVRRDGFLRTMAKQPASLVAMEACAGSNHWARELALLGHDVRLVPPQYVKPYVKTNKNDWRDAEAICEAAGRPGMRFVEPKSLSQQDVQSLHRVLARRKRDRVALINELRGLLLEYGVAVRPGIASLRRMLHELLEEVAEPVLTPMSRRLLHDLLEELSDLDRRVEALRQRIQESNAVDPRCQLLQTIPGFGPQNASALVAAIGNGAQFRSGRHLAAWLGLTPRHHATGGREHMLGISKRGNVYVRMLLIHGARAQARWLDRRKKRGLADTPLDRWLDRLMRRKHPNVAVVALAHRLARIAWAVLASGQPFDPHAMAPRRRAT